MDGKDGHAETARGKQAARRRQWTMPRLLPRLRQAWDAVRDKIREPVVAPSRPPRRQKPTGLKTPIENAISALSIKNRTRSLLLDRKNPIERKEDYIYRRAPLPRLYGQRLAKPKIDPVQHGFPSRARKMTEREREWWSSPYCKSTIVTTFTNLIANLLK